ncbi:PREDICTED: mini-chromosome maintenance complex-binding protein [Polistes canadensis]|uniref:mini-chromosome maintenance complex-binding protein n=1 Tax=Polistes canadensis TaxID=91411 RepID=UPI000718F126|nr:PREDICTED: mini-chromosome maintenance complex-binding protein [Polistes canadensis]
MSLNINNWTPEYFVNNQTSCKLILSNCNVLKEIPLLNNAPLHCFKDKQLVRFRGMIQDMYNPEYYFQKYEVKNTQSGYCDVRFGMYMDSVLSSPNEEIIFNSEKNISSERQTCVVISTPGLNDWAKEENTNTNNLNRNIINYYNMNKRSLENNEVEEMDCSEPTRKKEKLLTDETNETYNNAKNNKDNNGILSKEHILNFPVPIDDGKACIVKIYDETTHLKLNQIVDIIGFISLDPTLSVINNSEEMDDVEMNTHNPPVSLVPRLHVVKITVLIKHEVENAPLIISRAQAIRGDLHLILSQLLFGDQLAADYLICHLLSSIYMRKNYFCLGTYPLNITNFSIAKFKDFPKNLYNFLKLFIRKSHLLEVTLESLNDMTLIPKKDYECNRLTSGILQLSAHTHLVIDETGLTSGQVSQAGKQNYDAITNLVTFQKVPYDFKYYTMEYDTDIPVLILSEAKSFISCPTQVVLKEESENLYFQVIEATKQYLKDQNRLNNIRHYLEVLRHTEFEFNEDVTNVIQEDFVQMRQTNRNITGENLHSLIVLTRLMSLSYGQNKLTVECWKRTVAMELERINRLPQRNK